jgi:hypothetical protein
MANCRTHTDVNVQTVHMEFKRIVLLGHAFVALLHKVAERQLASLFVQGDLQTCTEPIPYSTRALQLSEICY